MNKDKKIKHLEQEVQRLREKEKKLEHDINIFKKIFQHLNEQMDEMKKDLKKP